MTLAAKLLVLCPSAKQIHALSTYVFNLARYDEDWDVRDRARFLKGLLRSILQTVEHGDDRDGQTDDDQGDVGGVVLRREQIKMVLLAAKDSIPTGIQQGKIAGLLNAFSPVRFTCAIDVQTNAVNVNSL